MVFFSKVNMNIMFKYGEKVIPAEPKRATRDLGSHINVTTQVYCKTFKRMTWNVPIFLNNFEKNFAVLQNSQVGHEFWNAF